ncbi:MAG TPA: sigma-70 family RNA polymerase sigma factor [Blastocatellia bacterium]|nr:sigma-70 family RNA polymerase sigma factor [Blastocatellia bacterium]
MESLAINTADAVADLVSRIRAGDRQAEAELVERYSCGVKFIIRREIGSSSIADDLYQETFRIIIEKTRRGDIREPEKLSGFVCGVARNLVIDYFRRAARQGSLSEVEEATTLPDPAPDQLEALLRKEQSDFARQVLKEMRNERDIQILFRFYLAEDKKEQICADLGLSGLHFNRVLHRARERYLELYKRLSSNKSR